MSGFRLAGRQWGIAVLKLGAIGNRVLVAIVMGGLAFILLSLLLVPGELPVGAGLFALALMGVGLLVVWLTRHAASVRSAWGRGCFINGVLTIALGLRVQDDLWSGRSSYMEELDRAIGPLTHFVWALAARLGLIAFMLAAALFAISYWLLGPPHRKA